MSIDCKAVANRYVVLLITIDGRTHEGHVCMFFMGFIPNETESSFVWFLRKFRSIIPVAPCLVAVDQCTACISPLRAELLETFITLDHWHLNQNQLKTVANWGVKTGRQDMCNRFAQNVFRMRNSTTESDFTQLLAFTDSTLFHELEIPLPRWYKYLYHEQPELVVVYYRNNQSSVQFLFQGSGYTSLLTLSIIRTLSRVNAIM